jgi:nucleotide-binding universal stress UspA family protein
MFETASRPTILVPVDLSTEERPPAPLLELLNPVKVVLVGWYSVPDQTALEQMRDEHEEEAIESIESIADEFSAHGADVETLVVFTRDRAETVDRVADEYGCDAILVPKDVRTVERVFVPIRGDVNLETILSFVDSLLAESDASVTLFHAAPEGEEDPSVGEVLLRGAKDELVEADVESDRIDTVNLTTDSPVDAIVDAAANHDVLIIGETEPSLVERILGDVPTQIIEGSNRPVLVVRKVE